MEVHTMCCCILETDVLLANFFAKYKGSKPVSFQTFCSYLDFLSHNIPTYVISNLSVPEVKRCAKQYPTLYKIEKINGKVFIACGEKVPKLSFFNSVYNNATASFIERLTEAFLKHQLRGG